MKKLIAFQVDEELFSLIEKAAQREHRSVSNYIRTILIAELENNKKKEIKD